MRKFIQKIIKILLFAKSMLPVYMYYLAHCTHRFGLSFRTYRNEYKKYVKLNRFHGMNHYQQMEDFFKTQMTMCSDHLKDDPELPTLIVVVKDELDRIKLFLEHYRRLGIQQFVIIDNDSTDGTREYAADQPGVRVFLVKEPFKTVKKVAWIEKALALTGYNRWYIVVDSDELIDYVGNENHSIQELIRAESKGGILCLQGYLVDMYSRNSVFFDDCTYRDISKVLSLFDKDSYYLKDKKIYGGPRYRVFGVENQLSKQAVFYFKPDMVYLSCHKMYLPDSEVREGRSYVIRHYKFLKQDRVSYSERVKKENYYNSSSEYKTIMKQLAQRGEVSFAYENSIDYKCSESLVQLPFLNRIEWENE